MMIPEQTTKMPVQLYLRMHDEYDDTGDNSDDDDDDDDNDDDIVTIAASA